jgi:putative intracellular protease/amidase
VRILMVLTSYDRVVDGGPKTGFWLETFTAAYYAFADAGADIALASPSGGQPPVDPNSDRSGHQPDTVKRFKGDQTARAALADTLWLDQVVCDDFDAVFYAGGHGPMWDLVEDPVSQALIAAMWAAGRPIALVGHGPAALCRAVDATGRPLVEGRRVTATPNSEERATGLARFLPFLLQDELVRLGAIYSQGPDGASHVVSDGVLITGQNANATADTAKRLLDILQRRRS